jgi:hypothetical protein
MRLKTEIKNYEAQRAALKVGLDVLVYFSLFYVCMIFICTFVETNKL